MPWVEIPPSCRGEGEGEDTEEPPSEGGERSTAGDEAPSEGGGTSSEGDGAGAVDSDASSCDEDELEK